MNYIIILFISLLGLNIFAQTIETADQKPIDYSARPFLISDFKTELWMREFTYFIVINKADSGADKQTLRIYNQQGQLVEFTRVSTGRENFEKGCLPGQDSKRDHCSNRAYWSTTPVGYFDIDFLEENYFSNLWETWMPYAVFFTDGIATHQAPGGTEPKLGRRASGGCIRSHPSIAPKIFALVKQAGKGLVPVIQRNGQLKKTTQGDVVRQQGYKTLVIVHNAVK
jgi:L,D-transpeptidase catalytic domain